MPSAIELGQNTLVELVTSYSAANQQIPGVASPPAWVVIGAFYMPLEATTVLEAVASVSNAGLAVKLRLFDVGAAAPVSGSDTAETSSTTDVRIVSGAFLVPGGKVYQYQAQCIGSTSENAIIRSAQLV